MEIRDKVVVVTGAANGIGKALARRFSEEGAGKIIIADLDEQGLKKVEKETGAESFITDVARETDIQHLVESCESKYGGIDLLCNNAGIGVHGGPEVPNEDWQKIWEINVMAHVYAARAAIPGMLRRGAGYILNTASAAGLLSQIGSAPYAVTKHAAVSFAEWLAITYGDRGIKVSVLCPQAVRTAMTADDPDGVASVDGMIEPDQVSEAVVAALKDESFLVLPHPKVLDYIQRKSGDYDRWIEGMKKLQSNYGTSNWP